MSEDGKNPLHRWSERKAKARHEEAPLPSEAQAVVPAESEDVAPAESEDEVSAEIVEQLPDIDSLDKDSDYTVFMVKGVPEHLKRLALRKLWLSDPILANVDGLVDYGEDFTTAKLMGDAVKTAYRVGKGYIDEAEELAEAEQGDSEGEELAEAEQGDSEGEGEDEVEVEVAQPAPDEHDEPADEG